MLKGTPADIDQYAYSCAFFAHAQLPDTLHGDVRAGSSEVLFEHHDRAWPPRAGLVGEPTAQDHNYKSLEVTEVGASLELYCIFINLHYLSMQAYRPNIRNVDEFVGVCFWGCPCVVGRCSKTLPFDYH